MLDWNKAARMPALHFFLAGALLFAAQQAWEAHSLRKHPPRESIAIRSEQIEQLKRDIKTQTGMEPSDFQVQAGIEEAIDDEILYRRALGLKLDRINPGIRHRLVQIAKFVGSPQDSDDVLYEKALESGLDKSDPVVRRQLIANMKLIARKLPTPSEPAHVSPEEIQAYYDRHSEQFMLPERYTLIHVYVSKDRWRAKGEMEAKRLLKELQSASILPSAPIAAGDLFLRGNRLARADASQLQDFFGSPSFASQIASLEPGKWQGPIPSAYGWHLVWIEERVKAQPKPLREVANQIKGSILNEREALRLERYLKEQRARCEIRVESPQASSPSSGKGPHA